MKSLILVIVLVLLAVFAYDVVRDRLPSGPPTVGSCSINEGTTLLQRGGLSVVLAMDSWDVQDYGFFKTAEGKNTKLFLVSNPLTKKWHKVE